MQFATADVTLPSDTEILVRRSFKGPRELVYQCYVQPELVKRWLLGPPGWSMPVCEIDLRVGGTYHYRWRNEESGASFGLRGIFDGIIEEEVLESRESFEDTEPLGESEVVQSFHDEPDGSTRVDCLIRCPTKEAREAALATGMTDGMEMSFKSLDDVLEGEQAGA